MAGIDPRADATHLVGHGFRARVLEPSPPPVTTAPWFADDPVNTDIAGDGPLVGPAGNGDVTWHDLTIDDPRLAPFCAEHWLGAWRELAPVADVARFLRTRRAWHAAAEHLLAPSRFAATGKIGLRFTAGGFGTPFFAHDGASVQLRVDGTELVVVRCAMSTTVTRIPLRDALHSGHEIDPAIIAPGTVLELPYDATTTPTPEVLGSADDASAALLGDWFGFGCSVLETLRAGAPDADATRCQLWPEHFDLAIELGDAASGNEGRGQRAAFGASPGDTEHAEPYLYVSPWVAPPDDPYWNDTAFRGASLPYAALTGDPIAARSTALAFLARGRELLAGD